MPSVVSVGLIGCGAIAAEHAASLRSLDGVSVRAYADVDETRATTFLHRYGGSYATGDASVLFADDALEAVYVCTHADSHAALGIAAARAGKHVLMEKPLALTLEECDRMVEEVDRTGILFMTGFKLRFYPSVERVRAFISRPTLVIAQMTDTRWPDEFWGNDLRKGGGNVLSQGCHTVDLVCHLMGSDAEQISAASANLTHPALAIVDTLAATLHFPGKRLASIVQADGGPAPLVSKFSFQVFDGVRSAHLHNRLRSTVLFDGARREELYDDEELGIARENLEFITSIREQRAPSCGVRDGRRAMRILLGALRSAEQGAAVQLPDSLPGGQG